MYKNQTNDSSRHDSPGDNIASITGNRNRNNRCETIVNNSEGASNQTGSITADNNSLGNVLHTNTNQAQGNITQNVKKRSGNTTIIKDNKIRSWKSKHS